MPFRQSVRSFLQISLLSLFVRVLINACVGMESGKLTAEQFINFMNQFAFDASNVEATGAGSMFTGIPALILCRFVDRFEHQLITSAYQS